MEIVGIEEVRVVIANEERGFVIHQTHLTLKNLLIYDRFEASMVTVAAYSGELTLVDIRIHGAKADMLYAERSSVVADRVTVIECFRVFEITRCRAKFSECRWKKISFAHAVIDCDLSISATKIVGASFSGLVIRGNVKANVRQCEILATTDGTFLDGHGMEVHRGSRLSIEDSKISHFKTALLVSDSHSTADVRKCRLVDCGIGLTAFLNPIVTVSDCELAVKVVLQQICNTCGKVDFRRNSPSQGNFPLVGPLVIAGFMSERGPVLLTDGDRELIRHDFENPQFMGLQRPTDDPYAGQQFGASHKSREEQKRFCASMHDQIHAPAQLRRYSVHDMKKCEFCLKSPCEVPGSKFQYCSVCRNVCYCSKTCQKDHWKDHQFFCKKA